TDETAVVPPVPAAPRRPVPPPLDEAAASRPRAPRRTPQPAVPPPPGDGYATGPARGPHRRRTALIIGVLVLLAIAGGVAVGLTAGGDDDPRTVASDPGTTTTDPPTTTTAPTTDTTTSVPTTPTTTTTPSTTETSTPGDTMRVDGGGTVAPADGEGALTDGTATAAYRAPQAAWSAVVARPGGGWAAPTRTWLTAGRLSRLRQSGPGGRVIIIDHTPREAATFDPSRADEQRSVGGTIAGESTAFVFRDAEFVPECGRLTCVDIPVNAGPNGPGWGILVAAPTVDEALADATLVARSVAPGG
ncbi:MAG: hypothetical protein AB7G37_04040, partial [Solirubrobacteraceae bacterium]